MGAWWAGCYPFQLALQSLISCSQGSYDRLVGTPASPSAQMTTRPPSARTGWPPTSLQSLTTPTLIGGTIRLVTQYNFILSQLRQHHTHIYYNELFPGCRTGTRANVANGLSFAPGVGNFIGKLKLVQFEETTRSCDAINLCKEKKQNGELFTIFHEGNGKEHPTRLTAKKPWNTWISVIWCKALLNGQNISPQWKETHVFKSVNWLNVGLGMWAEQDWQHIKVESRDAKTWSWHLSRSGHCKQKQSPQNWSQEVCKNKIISESHYCVWCFGHVCSKKIPFCYITEDPPLLLQWWHPHNVAVVNVKG